MISAGLAPTDQDDEYAMPDMKFFAAMYAAGAGPYFDMLGVHAPGYGSPPERSPDEAEADEFWQGRTWVFRHVEDVRDLMVAQGDGDKQIAVTEMGWTSATNNVSGAGLPLSKTSKSASLRSGTSRPEASVTVA